MLLRCFEGDWDSDRPENTALYFEYALWREWRAKGTAPNVISVQRGDLLTLEDGRSGKTPLSFAKTHVRRRDGQRRRARDDDHVRGEGIADVG
jgi:hypothetical protein